MPTEASSVSVAATASLPIMFDFGPNQGDPDLASSTRHLADPGRYTPPAGQPHERLLVRHAKRDRAVPGRAPAGTVSMSMSATAKAFDTAVTSDTGDLELAATNPATTFSPVVINPGQSATVNVTITPSGASGTRGQRHPVRR